MTIRSLILDDEVMWRDLIREILEEEGHKVDAVADLEKARAALATKDFHLVVVDVVLAGEAVGLDLLMDIEQKNRDRLHYCLPVILTGYPTLEKAEQALHNGAFRFLRKPNNDQTQFEPVVLKRGSEGRGFVETELRRASRSALREVLLVRSENYRRQQYTLGVRLRENRKSEITLSGPTGFVTESSKPFEVSIDSFSRRADDLQFHFNLWNSNHRKEWRNRAQLISEDLHGAFYQTDGELARCLAIAAERSRNQFHVRFTGFPELLRLPLELLPGRTGYLVTERPVTRQIPAVDTVVERGLDHVFFENVPEIKILLIGANTKPSIPGVDQEISLVGELLPKVLNTVGLSHRIRVVPSQEAFYDNVYDVLTECPYHIVHYAGHGFHDEDSSDESGILLWKNNTCSSVKPLPIRILRNLFRNSDARFVFLSCCVGAATTPKSRARLNGNDFQGIVEGLVRTGVPGVLGYRWDLRDSDAKTLASTFYENLFTDLRLDTALFKARVRLQEDDHLSETWASPILVTQET